MKRSTRYIKGLGNSALGLRIRDASTYWNFTTSGWVGTESSNTRVLLTEYPDAGDSVESNYQVSFTPPNGLYDIEIFVISTWETISTGDTSVGQIGDIYSLIGTAGAGLTSIGDSSGVSTLLERVSGNLTTTNGKVDINDKTGFSGVATNMVPDLSAEISAIKAKTDHLPTGIRKNIAQSNFAFYMRLSNNHISPATGKIISASRSIDGGAFVTCTNTATEIGNGFYKINLSASDLNGDIISLRFTTTEADATVITIKTTP